MHKLVIGWVVTFRHATRSPIKQYLKTQNEELGKLINETESKINESRKKSAQASANKLAEGMDKINDDDNWENKKNMYDGD